MEKFQEQEELARLADSIRDKVLKIIADTKDEATKSALCNVISEIELSKRGALNPAENERTLRERLEKNITTNPEGVLREYVDTALKWAIRDGIVVSLIVFAVLGPGGRDVFVPNLQQLVKASLRRRADFVISNGESIFVVLHETEKEEAISVAERIRSILDDYLLTKEGGKKIGIDYKVTSSSEGIDSFDAMMARMGR